MDKTGRPNPEESGQVLPREGSGFKNHEKVYQSDRRLSKGANEL